MVGAGGIGCELLKTLALSGFQDIHIAVLHVRCGGDRVCCVNDVLRLFSVSDPLLLELHVMHVLGKPRVVARDAVLRFRPHISITPYHANVKILTSMLTFQAVSVVLNGLDNLDARRHVNRLCLAAEVPLVTVHVKGKTECYECQPKPAPKTYPVCTITSTPSKEIGNLSFDKDDQLAVEFVTAAANFELLHLGFLCIASLKLKSPLSLEINTHRSKLRDFVEKIVKAKLGMNFPLIMHESKLLYEVGDDLEDDMIANYTANLEKVLSELPSSVTGGTMLTVEDLQQEFTCNIYIKHREEFDEEKEPDGMVLSGWTRAPDKKDDNKSVGNGGSTSKASPTEAQKAVELDEISEGTEISGKKRKRPEVSTNETNNHNEVQKVDVVDDEDDELVMLDHWDTDNKKKRLQ
ncbi:hypothetical protein GH714_031411 [Hevea brasiliensis]|uniref:Ubiquitin/SUMO-activating enzyme ubiquitin-like domain-containing protein n=1 Tax=Hevea brasiliensis TaxID=3981 RepID=A0A6A6NDF6_HEVBR|nr:hypothetical protein GH714_031411 [Hevea brasiliensis]